MRVADPVDGPEEIEPAWLQGKQRIGVTASASAPEALVRRVVDRIRERTGAEVGQLAGVEEGVLFPLPKGLAKRPLALKGGAVGRMCNQTREVVMIGHKGHPD